MLTTSTGEEGKSLAYPATYFDTCRSCAPVHEKRRMSEGEFEEVDCQVSIDERDVVLPRERGCLSFSSYVYVELLLDSTKVSESSFSILDSP